MEEKVGLCGEKLSSSYEMPRVIIKEFETESVIKWYHAYMNDRTPILGENLSTRPEPENEINMLWLLLKTHGWLARKAQLDKLKLFFTS